MRVVLRVDSGSSLGMKILLLPDQVFRIGRTERADLALHGDERMSSVHFELLANHVGCGVKDLNSTNGTWVNDEPVCEALLKNGDLLRAGETLFSVLIEGDDQATARASISTIMDINRSTITAVAPGRAAHYMVEPGVPGLTLASGTTKEIAPVKLAESVGRLAPLYLMLDLNRAGVTLPPSVKSRYLMDWLADPARSQVSPVLFAHADHAEASSWLAQAWGSDALVCLFTYMPLDQLSDQIRGVMRRDERSRGNSFLGCCWPNVLTSILRNYDHVARSFMKNIDAVLAECPDDPEAWQMYGDEQMLRYLEKVGLTRKEPQDVVSAVS